MRRPRYPLEPLADLRARKVEGAVQGLAKAVAEREQAEQARLAREQARMELGRPQRQGSPGPSATRWSGASSMLPTSRAPTPGSCAARPSTRR